METAKVKERLTSLAGVALLHLLLGWALLTSLAPSLVRGKEERLEIFELPPERPPPPPLEPEPEPRVEPKPGPAPLEEVGAAAPPSELAQVRRIVATPSPVEQEVSPPVAAGLVPASGGVTSPIGVGDGGVGGGSGGSGSGSGSGNSGSGSGGGGAGGDGSVVERTKLRSGRIIRSDYPRAAKGHQGTVVTRLVVSETGSVTSCTVTRSSGNDVLDAATCRLIRERFRYSPARDAQGNAVPDHAAWQQSWWRDSD